MRISDWSSDVCSSDLGRRRFDGYVALGCVIRGETTHYDYVCSESARKLQDLACEHTLALGYGILTCENDEQALARAPVRHEERRVGTECVSTCIYRVCADP